MSVDRAATRVLARLSDSQVEALSAVCDGLERPDAPGLTQVVAGASPDAHDAVAALASEWRALPSLSGDGVALALRLGLSARRERHAQRSKAVWTGPGAEGTQRLTASVLHELVVSAKQRILMVSYAAYTLSELASDLEAAVQRGCEVDVVFETEEDSAGAYSGPQSRPFAAVAGIRRWRWPADERPGTGAVLHAKVLVVDGRRALVGSANLTHRALTANLEAGVLLADPGVAADLEAHVRGLMADGVLVEASH